MYRPAPLGLHFEAGICIGPKRVFPGAVELAGIIGSALLISPAADFTTVRSATLEW